MFYCDYCRVQFEYPVSPGWPAMVSRGNCEICGNTEFCHDYKLSGTRMIRVGKLERISCGQCGEFHWAQEGDYLCTFCRGVHERPDPDTDIREHSNKINRIVQEMVDAAKEGHEWDSGDILRRLREERSQETLDKPMEEP